MTESLSDFDKVALGQEVSSFDLSPQFSAYSGVEIVDDDGNSELVGTQTGRILTIPGISREQAQTILNSLTSSGFQYQPYKASDALLNPAAELGDGVTIAGTYSGIYKISRSYSPLMSADIEAPLDEELDHEYPYEPKQDRIFKREIGEVSAKISMTQELIESEVTRATTAEGTLSSRISQNATDITAKVSTSGGVNSSFAWTLNSNGFTLTSSNTQVFKCTSSGVEINGKVTAKSGSIGGFTIGTSALYNGMTSLNSTANGVYVGTNGISVGGGKFKVTSSGAVSAANMTLTGTLNIGGTTITAAALRSGAQSAYNNASSWTTGAGYGVNYNNATKQNTTSYPAWFKCTTLSATNITAYGLSLSGESFSLNGSTVRWRSKNIDGTVINYLGL